MACTRTGRGRGGQAQRGLATKLGAEFLGRGYGEVGQERALVPLVVGVAGSEGRGNGSPASSGGGGRSERRLALGGAGGFQLLLEAHRALRRLGGGRANAVKQLSCGERRVRPLVGAGSVRRSGSGDGAPSYW